MSVIATFHSKSSGCCRTIQAEWNLILLRQFVHLWLNMFETSRVATATISRALISRACVCASTSVPKSFKLHLTHSSRGQQGVHSFAANEDSCRYSVKRIGAPICVPANLTVDHAVPLSFCFHGCSARYFPKQVSLSRFPQTFVSPLQPRTNLVVATPARHWSLDSAAFLFPRSFSRGIGLYN